MMGDGHHSRIFRSAASGALQRESRGGRIFLILMFVTLVIDSMPGRGLGIAPGLSAKNLYLYIICFFIGARSVMDPYGLRFSDLNIHLPFLLIIGYAFFTLSIRSIFDPTYNTLGAIKTLKNRELDLYLLMFIFAYLLSCRQDFLRIIRIFMVFMFISSFITLIDFLNIPDLGIVGTHRGRIEGPIGAANQYGTLLAFLLPISIATIPENRPVARWLWRFGILIFAILLIGTGSRGAYVATVSGSMFAVFYLREYMDLRVVGRVAIGGLLTVIVLVSAFLVFNPEFFQSLHDKTATGDLESASSGRWAIWGAGFGVMLEAPYSFLVGYGWNTFDNSGIWRTAHSEYVNRYFELGVIGLLAFIYLLWSIIQNAKRSLHRAGEDTHRLIISFIFAMFILVVNVAFVIPYKAGSFIWIIIGLMMGVQRTLDQPLRQPMAGTGTSETADFMRFDEKRGVNYRAGERRSFGKQRKAVPK